MKNNKKILTDVQTFDYQKLTEQEQHNRKILGRLKGIIADTKNPTRNGRAYSEKLWENVFNDPIMQEKIKNRCVFGELGHPEDRTEIDMEKIAVCLAELPQKGSDGKLYGVLDILDTPNGRILKTLCDYGCTVGVSSRGQGDLITDDNGDEAVDPDTYQCECWDVVLVPAVKEARMQYVKEGLDTNSFKMKQALTESLNKATEEEKKIMEETLQNLDIKLDDENKEPAEGEEVVEIKKESGEVPTEVKDPAEEKPELEVVSDTDKVTVEEPIEKSEEEKEKSDEEIFLNYLSTHFDEEAIKKACEVLDIDVEEVEEKEEEKPVEKPGEEKEDDKVEEALVTVTSSDGVTTVDTDTNTVNTEAETVNVDALKSEPAPELASAELSLETEPIEELPTEGSEEIPTEEPVEEPKKDSNDESQENIDEEPKEDDKVKEAIDNGANELVKSLQEALKSKSDLEGSIKSLQEKLAAGDARVNELTEECNKYKEAVARLATLAKSNKDLKENVSKLEESLSEKEETINSQQLRISRLVKSRKESVNESASLTESVNSKTTEISSLNEQVKTLKEELTKKENESSAKVDELTESLNKATTLKESYKKLANKVVNRYIEIKANMIGLTATDIKRKLGESYSIEDVDKVCEDLKSYQLNVSRLPFEVNRKVGIRVNEGSARLNTVKSSTKSAYDDDDVDDGLIKLANI